MTLAYALVLLFEETSASQQRPAIEALVGGAWQPVPLEWNVAKRLADICKGEVRMFDGDGSVTREYAPSRREHA